MRKRQTHALLPHCVAAPATHRCNQKFLGPALVRARKSCCGAATHRATAPVLRIRSKKHLSRIRLRTHEREQAEQHNGTRSNTVTRYPPTILQPRRCVLQTSPPPVARSEHSKESCLSPKRQSKLHKRTAALATHRVPLLHFKALPRACRAACRAAAAVVDRPVVLDVRHRQELW